MPTPAELLVPPLLAFVLAATLGLGLALLRARGRTPGWLALDVAVLLPAFLPVPALAAVLLGVLPGIDRVTPWILAAGLAAAGFAYLPARLALARVAPAYRDTGRLLGLPPLAHFRRIVAPLTWRAFALGKLLALTRVAGEWLLVVGALDRLTVLTGALAALALAAALATAFALPPRSAQSRPR